MLEIAKLVPTLYLEQRSTAAHTLFGETTDFWRKISRDMVKQGILEVRMYGNGRKCVTHKISPFYDLMCKLDDSLF